VCTCFTEGLDSNDLKIAKASMNCERGMRWPVPTENLNPQPAQDRNRHDIADRLATSKKAERLCLTTNACGPDCNTKYRLYGRGTGPPPPNTTR